MKKEKRDVFVSEDGKVFDSEQACLDHEARLEALAKRKKNLKIYKVVHGFDATEGRGFFRRTLIITDMDYAYALSYCFRVLGDPVQPWYGTSTYTAWRISTADMSLENVLTLDGDTSLGMTTMVIFLSTVALDGLPKNINLKDVKKDSK